jgi:hypothetical protein
MTPAEEDPTNAGFEPGGFGRLAGLGRRFRNRFPFGLGFLLDRKLCLTLAVIFTL